MDYLPLLEMHLKSDEIIDLLETYDMEVVYEFDRLHENLPDEYQARCAELGLELLFDADQRLKTVFIHLVDANGFTPADLTDSDVLRFDTKRAAASHALREGIAVKEGRSEFLGKETDWIRFEYEGYSVHYEYRRGSLALITLTAS